MRGEDGRDGQDGRDGLPGATGERGEHGMADAQDSPGSSTGGLVYTRWGRSFCPVGGAQLIYTGWAGKARAAQGGGGNYQCMPNVPEFSEYHLGIQAYSYMYPVEYKNPLKTSSNNKNAPCAACYVPTREVVLMIPARITCPYGWTMEYSGFLMTSYLGSDRKSATFECVDSSFEGIP